MRYDYDAIFNWIIQFKRDHDGNSPTVREIKSAFGVSSTSVVNHILARLEQQGRLYRSDFGLSRMLCVAGGRWESPSSEDPKGNGHAQQNLAVAIYPSGTMAGPVDGLA